PLYHKNRLVLCVATPLFTVFLWALQGLLRRRPVRLGTGTILLSAMLFVLLQIFCALSLRHTPFTDTEQIVTAAKNLAQTGSYEQSPRTYQYFSWYPFNLGTVYLYAFLFRLFGLFGFTDTYLVIAVFAGILFSVGLISGTKCAVHLRGDLAGIYFLILSGICFPFYYCTAELYTDVLALPFPVLLLYLYLKADNCTGWKRHLLLTAFALLLLIGTQIRFTVLILPIACLMDALLKKKIRLFTECLVLSAVILAVGTLSIERVNAAHLGKENLETHRLSVWHYLAMGLPVHEDDGYGQYGDGGWLIFSTSFSDPGERDAQLRRMIKDRVYYLRYPNRMLNMLSRKNVSTFGDGSFHLNELIEADEHDINNGLKNIIYANGKGYPVYYHICSAMFYAQMLIAALSCFRAVKKRQLDAAPVFITLVGAFIYLTMWETNARYFFMFEFLLLLAASLCFDPPKEKDRPQPVL
ncbi:MAG: hypothetical protein IJ088_05500, partial [Clostridia bacterium]|nr:hypothetical protein [Clostridia bacterium]